MASIIRKGNIPYPLPGLGEYLEETFTINGFFGDWAHIYRKRNLAHPKSWSSDKLMYHGVDTNALRPADAADPRGLPMPLFTGDGVAISLSGRSKPMPFAEKNVDYHQIRFYQKGKFLLETELGPLKVEEGDFVTIPKGMIYRETPVTEDNSVVIFEVEEAILLAENLWDKVGFVGNFIDYSEMELPTPHEGDANSETEVRVKFDGEYHTMVYDFDPCKDVIGWLGDPVIYKMSVWDIPGIGTTRGFLTPPSNAVLYGEGKSFFFNALGPRPFPTTPPPKGSYGAPAHLNDYDEVWLNHVSEFAAETDGHFWFLPRTIPHPGLKRPAEYPANPLKEIREMKINFDTKAKLSLTPEAKLALLPDPQVSLYTSLYGAHIGVVPEAAQQHVKK